MNKSTKIFLAYGIGIIFILLIVSFIYILADKTNLDNPQFSLDLTFASTMGTLLAVALALIAIGYSIKRADVEIFLGEKTTSPASTLQQIRIRNKGDAMADLAFIFVELDVPATSSITFSGATGLDFTQTRNLDRIQYRLDAPQNARSIYPVKDDFSVLGFVNFPKGSENKLKCAVHVVGTQGLTKKEFEITI